MYCMVYSTYGLYDCIPTDNRHKYILVQYIATIILCRVDDILYINLYSYVLYAVKILLS